MKTTLALLLITIFFNWISYAQTQRCGTPTPSQTVSENSLFKITNNITIPVIMHVIYGADGTGNVSDSQLQDQINVLNSARILVPDTHFTWQQLVERRMMVGVIFHGVRRQSWT